MARNIHQNRRLKNHKPATVSKAAAQPVAVTPQPAAAAPAPVKPVMAKAAQQSAAMRFPELPSELRRIAFFTAFVVILLIVLWFFIR
jgi:hypothetical protein